MEESAASQLPEADSLPDGFVESSAEPLVPCVLSNGPGKQLDYIENNLLDLEQQNDSSKEMLMIEDRSIGGKVEKAHKVRTFPVPLSEKDDYDASEESAGVSVEGCFEQTELLIPPEQMRSASASSVGCKLTQREVDEKERDHLEFKSSEKTCRGGSDTISDQSNEQAAAEFQKNQKEIPEVKRKSSKRSFKTEKDFLEFTLRYQQVLSERDSAISVRDKLESLCRELQRQNKKLLEECRRVSEEGQILRSDLSTKFHDTIKNVSTKLEEQKGECLSQLKENEMLRDKLKQFADQHALSEQQYARQLKQKELELKIAELKIQQHEQKFVQEQAQMKLYAEQVSQLLATEKNLRSQLTADGEKFQQFQDALMKSNEVFETYKQEIEKMVKLNKELKKENSFLKAKCDKSDYTLVELLEERERMKKELEKTKKQKDKLESLCRSLQAERKQLTDDK